MAKAKRKGVVARTMARVKAALATATDGAVDAMASYANAPLAAEVDNEKQRWSPLAYVHHQRDLMSANDTTRKRAERGRREWQKRLMRMERSAPDEYAAYMLKVDEHIDAGELVFILPPEEMERVRERAKVSGPRVLAEAINAPYHGVTPAELADGHARAAAEREAAEREDEEMGARALELLRCEYPLRSNHAQLEAYRVSCTKDIGPDLREQAYGDWPRIDTEDEWTLEENEQA